jgi:phosphoglycolate phosphatase
MRMVPVEALIFDLDGTLVDSSQDIAQAVRYIQRQMGFPPSNKQDIVSYIGDGVTKLLQRALPDAPPSTIQAAERPFLAYYFEHSLDHTTVYPQVEETLAHFRQKRMAVVTNKPLQASRHILEKLGLLPYFQLILGGDSVVRKKPDPDPVRKCLEELGLRNPKSAAIVGDGAQDILAGRQAGVFTCGIPSNIGDPNRLRESNPDFLILKIDELMRIFN